MTTMVPTRIDVTDRYLIEGQIFTCADCAVALAINTHLDHEHHAEMSYHFIYIRGGVMGTWADLRTPTDLRDILLAIDRGDRVAPFSFLLEIPEEVLA